MKAPVLPAQVPFMRCSGLMEVGDLGVLAAELDDHIHFRVERLGGLRAGR